MAQQAWLTWGSIHCARSSEEVPALGLSAPHTSNLSPRQPWASHICHHQMPLPIFSAGLLLPRTQRWRVEKHFKAASAFLLFCCYCSRFLRVLGARKSAKKITKSLFACLFLLLLSFLFLFFLISHLLYTHQCICVNPNLPIHHTTRVLITVFF